MPDQLASLIMTDSEIRSLLPDEDTLRDIVGMNRLKRDPLMDAGLIMANKLLVAFPMINFIWI